MKLKNSFLNKSFSIKSEYGQTVLRFSKDEIGIYGRIYDVDDGWVGDKLRTFTQVNLLYTILTGEELIP